MNKSELVREISVKVKLSMEQADKAVSSFFDSMLDALKVGGRVELRGFGSFSVREYDGYMGRNPRSGETVSVAPKRLPFFKPGKEFKNAINS